MEVSMKLQALSLLISFILGFIFGGVYDIIRISRVMTGVKYGSRGLENARIKPLRLLPEKASGKLFRFAEKLRGAWIFVSDILFFSLLALSLCVFVYAVNFGQTRAFMIAATSAGFFSYYNTVGRIVILFSEYISYALKVIFSYIVYYAALPFVFLTKKIISAAWALCVHLKSGVCRVYSSLYSRGARRQILSSAKRCGFTGENGYGNETGRKKKENTQAALRA